MKKPMDIDRHEAIESLLSIDTVHVVEQLTNRHFQALPENVKLGAVGLEIDKNRIIHKMMVDSGDFSRGDNYDRRRMILEREGFVPVHVNQYNPGPWNGKDQPDRLFSIWVNKEHGIVVVQATYTSYNEDGTIHESCDHAKAYFCWRPDDPKNTGVISTGSGGWESVQHPNWRSMDPPSGSKDMFFTPQDLYFRGYQTGDRALIHKLQDMLLYGTFMPQWPEWDDGKYPLGSMFCDASDWKTIQAQYKSGVDQLAPLSAASCKVYDSLPVLHTIMNIKPTWRNK